MKISYQEFHFTDVVAKPGDTLVEHTAFWMDTTACDKAVKRFPMSVTAIEGVLTMPTGEARFDRAQLKLLEANEAGMYDVATWDWVDATPILGCGDKQQTLVRATAKALKPNSGYIFIVYVDVSTDEMGAGQYLFEPAGANIDYIGSIGQKLGPWNLTVE